MNNTKRQKTSPKQSQKSSFLAYIALFVASCSLVLFLFVDHLHELKEQDLERVSSFNEAYELRQASPSRYLPWLSADYFLQRNLALDTKLLSFGAQTQSRLIKSLTQEPLKFLPDHQTKQNHHWRAFKYECQALESLIEKDQSSPQLKLKVQNFSQRCSAIIVSLEAWYQAIGPFKSSLTTNGDHQSLVKQANLNEQDFQSLAPIQVLDLKIKDQQLLKRYTFAWYRYWVDLVLDQIEAKQIKLDQQNGCKDLPTLKACVTELLKDIEELQSIDQKTLDLSQDLNEIISLRLRRLVQWRWRMVWESYLPSSQAKDSGTLPLRTTQGQQTNQGSKAQSLSEHNLMSKLYQLYQIPRVAQTLSSSMTDGFLTQSSQDLPKNSQTNSHLAIPGDLLRLWRTKLEQISHLGFAKTLERLGYSHQSSLTDVKQVWFMPLLNSKVQNTVLLELRALTLRLNLQELFKSPHQQFSEGNLQRLDTQIKVLESSQAQDSRWRQRLSLIRGLLSHQWRSVQGGVTCTEQDFNLHTRWKDLGVIDRLVPLIYLKSDRDQSKLSRRTGRVQWGLKNHHNFYVALYDEDQLTQVDLLFEDKNISVEQLIRGTKIHRHGCTYFVKLLGLEPIQRWLYTD